MCLDSKNAKIYNDEIKASSPALTNEELIKLLDPSDLKKQSIKEMIQELRELDEVLEAEKEEKSDKDYLRELSFNDDEFNIVDRYLMRFGLIPIFYK